MRRLLILTRVISFSLFLAMPAVLMSVAFLGEKGIFLGLGISLTGMLVIATLSERSLARAHFAGPQTPKGLRRSLEMAVEGKQQKLPHLLVFADPSPNALIIRSLGGNGTILFSQGLVALLNEEELRAVLRLCVGRIQEPGIIFQSFCSTLAVWALSFAPQAWVSLVFAGRALSKTEERLLAPLSAIGFLALFPIVRFFLNFGRPPASVERPSGLGKAYSAAVQKVAQAVHIWGPSKNHGAFPLYFVDPGSGKMLFPYN